MEIKSAEKVWDMAKCTIHPDLQEMLIQQISHEAYNYKLYNSFGSYFYAKQLPGLGAYFCKRAVEEQQHQKWCIEFANEVGLEYKYPESVDIEETWDNDVTPFELSLDAEIETTEMIYDMADKAKEISDHIFLQWLYKPFMLVEEQREELALSRKTLAIMKMDDSILTKQEAIAKLYDN